MDVLLINPPWTKRKGNIWEKVAGCMPPLGLAYMASFLEEKNVKVKILDLQTESLSSSDIYEKIEREKETPSFIGITATTSIIDNALKIAQICKTTFPKSKIVLGGVHPTVLPDEVLGNKNVDYVIRGEGEETLWELISGKREEDILGLSYREKERCIHNAERPFIEQLDNLPFPAYHLLPVKKYHPALGAYKRLPAISMITTRGCPGRCTFCFGSFLGTRVRMHSAKYIVEEIKLLQRDYGIKEISFYDDTFTALKKKVQEFCLLIVQENIDITWSCFSRVDFIDETTLRSMKKTGCHQICYGIESGNEEILKNIKKKTSLDKARDTIAMTKHIGIEARATFMLGNPGETREMMEETINFAIALDPDISLFNITTPYPGTEMYNWAVEKGYLRTKVWSKYDLSYPVMKLPTVNTDTVEHYYQQAHRRFYRRPGYLFKRLLKIRTTNDLKMALKAVLGIF
ncbi:Anaerobic magnesium-protoporphyrin IX monomethyl ester cyclase [subsurface metagenome]